MSNEFTKVDHDPEFRPQKIDFSHTPTGTNITIRRAFSMLEDIEKQVLFPPKDEFAQTVKLAGWDDVTSLHVLKSSVGAVT